MSENKEEIKNKLKNIVVEGSAGGDYVTVKANLLGEILKINISDELFNLNDKKMIEDLVLGAINETLSKAKEEMIKNSMDLPDSLKNIFDNFNF